MKKTNLFIRLLCMLLIACTCLTFLVACDDDDDRSSRVDDDEWELGETSKKPSVTTKQPSTTTKPGDETTTSNSVTLNPFEGISITVSGVSPYCKVDVNNANCSEDVQQYVTYTVDQEYYSNGDTAVITAKLNSYATSSYYNKGKTYELSSTEYSYSVKNQPEYITSISGVNLTQLKSELTDYVNAEIAENVTNSGYKYPFDVQYYRITAITPTLQKTYLSSLKLIKQDKMSSYVPYNQLAFAYSMEVTYEGGKTDIFWVSIYAQNVVKYRDGTVKWGTNNQQNYSFSYKNNKVSLDNCVSVNIMNSSADYNISQVTLP